MLSTGEPGDRQAGAGAGVATGHWTFRGRGSVTRLAGKDAPGTEEETTLNGTVASGGTAVLTPYAGMTLTERAANALRVGGRLELGSSVSLSVEGNRSENTAGTPEYDITLRGALRW